MADDRSRSEVEAALERLLETIKTPRALVLHAQDQVVLEQAVGRVRAQLLNPPEPILTVVLAGGTGAGKSALINALAEAPIAESSPLRPTTTTPCVYHHRDIAPRSLPVALTAEAIFVPHNHPPLRSKVIIDTPDLDSFATHHRSATRALLKAAGLVLYVFSPQNYRDERTWGVLREERRFSACAAVLNKVDLVTPAELEAITADLHQVFARFGLPEIRMFRTVAMASMSGDTAPTRMPPADADDLMALRAFLEQELQSSDIARLRQRQQGRVFAHLQAEIDRVAPLRLLEQFDDAVGAVSERLDHAATQLFGALADQLTHAQAALVPRATLRLHERFWGPFRTWLAITDGLRFGLPGFVRRFLKNAPQGDVTPVEPLSSRSSSIAADLLREEAAAVQSLLYARGLPIHRWRMVTMQADGSRLMADIASTLETRVEAAAAASAGRGGAVVWMLSTLGRLVPATFVLIGLYVMSRDLLAGDYLGLPLLGHLVAMLVLSFIALQGLASVFLPSARRWQGPDLGRQAIAEVLTGTMTSWISAYRSDLEADLADLRGPLVALQSTLVLSPTPDVPTSREPLL